MARTLLFCMVFRKFSEITNNKPFFIVSTIFFTNINISFFNLHFDRFSVIVKKSQSNQEQCSLCCSSPCFCVLLCTHYGLLQCFSTCFHKLKEIVVLQPMSPDCVISCDYGLEKR